MFLIWYKKWLSYTTNVFLTRVPLLVLCGTLYDLYTWYTHFSTCLGGRGYLVERWIWVCVAQTGCLFGLSGLPMAPFFHLKIGLDIGHIFANSLIFDEFFLWFTYRLSKRTYASQITWYKVPIVLKKGLLRNNGLDIGCKFASSLV